ncbi:MAG: hypothetical protein AMS21_06190 [Gemmatimonas sp. SG8_38_2]|nr:MAG: hypothetical protein AMS21_06190 [Gemmatimonas sp. SG8_38_2]
MLSLRQLASVVWTFLGFMVVASLVLNLRYKSLDDGDVLYLDTWTGKVHSGVAASPAPDVVVAEAPKAMARGDRLDIVILGRSDRLEERRIERHVEHHFEQQEAATECASVRFAFPAPVARYRP